MSTTTSTTSTTATAERAATLLSSEQEAAYLALYERCASDVLQAVQRASRAAQQRAALDSDDMAQMVWMRILRRWPHVLRKHQGDMEAQRAYVLRTAINMSTDTVRRGIARRKLLSERLPQALLAGAVSHTGTSSAYDARDAAEHAGTRETLRETLSMALSVCVKPEQRELLRLRCEGYTNAEIAQHFAETGVGLYTTTTIRSQWRRLLRRVVERLDARDMQLDMQLATYRTDERTSA